MTIRCVMTMTICKLYVIWSIFLPEQIWIVKIPVSQTSTSQLWLSDSLKRWQWKDESAQFAKPYILQLQFSKLQFHNWQTPTSQLNVPEQGWQWKGESAQFAKLAKPISQFLVKTNGPQSIAPRLSCYLRIKPNGHKWGSIVVEISPPPI